MEMPLRIYTPYLDMTGEIDGYSSAQLERNYHDVGEVEIHVNLHAHNADKIQQGSIISLGDSASKAMIVRHMEIELTDEGKQSEEWTIKGPTLQGLMSQRITVPPKDSGYDRKSGAAETVMKHYVRQNFIEAADSKRVMKELLIAPDKERGEHVSHESRYKNVADELANISKESGLGWIIYIDYTRHKFVFDVVDGLNLEQNNEEGYDPIFFSPDFGTIKQQSFSDSDLEMANHGYVAGQGEGKDRKVVEVGDKTGMNRFETFVDARDVGESDDDDEEKSEDEIEKELEERGKKKMQDLENELSLDAEILSPTTREAYEWKHDGYLQPIQPHGHYERKEQQVTPFVYERDFDLGDTVPVYNRKWGITMTARITKIKEIHEPGGFRLEATFGKERPTIQSKIRDISDEVNGIEKQEIAAQLVKKESKLRDDKLTQEQRDRIKQAQENLEEAKDYTYDRDTIDDKDKDTLDQSKKDAQDKANAAQDAAEKVADAKAKLAEENAIANADGKITSEEKKRIEEAKKNLKDAKNDAKSKSDAAEKAAKDYADAQDKIVAKEAREDAKEKADAAQSAAEKVAKAKADLAKAEAIEDSDGKITKEEKRAIQDAKDKLSEAKKDAKEKVDKAEKSAREYAELKSKEAQEAAEDVAEKKADLAEEKSKAHADDKISKEQKARIKQAEADLEKAKAAAELAETQAKAYSDGKVSDEEKRAIKDAKDKLNDAKKHADEADKKVEENAKKHTEDYSEQKIHVGDSEPDDKNKKWLDTSGSHDKWRRYNHDASDDDNIDDKWPTTDVIDKDTTFANEWLLASHIESLNGLTVGEGQFEVDDSGNVFFAGTIRGADGEFTGTVKGGKIETTGESNDLGGNTRLELEGGRISGVIGAGDKESQSDEEKEKDISTTNTSVSSDDDDETGKGDDDDSYKYDTALSIIPNELRYRAGSSVTTVSNSAFKTLFKESPDSDIIKRSVEMTPDGVYFVGGSGKPSIEIVRGDSRNGIVLRGEREGYEYGSNLYLYGNNDSDMPGVFRLYDGTKELLRGQGGNLYSYTAIRSMSKYLIESTENHGLIHMPNDGLISFNTADGAEILGIRASIGSDNRRSIRLPGLEHYTTGASANLRITDNHHVVKSTSSKKYKKNIEDVDEEKAEEFFRRANPVWFKSTASADPEGYSYYGYIAEEVAEIDPRLADFDSKDEPSGVAYDRVPVMHHVIIRQNRDRIEALEDENKDLKARLEKLEKAINAN